jgi:TonB-dependent receptor-like protein/carboxypeptidase family protein
MNSLSRLVTSAAAVGGLVLLFASSDLSAEPVGAEPVGAEPAAGPAVHVAALSAGSIQGVVQDENGVPVRGAVVWALGATTTFDVTDGSGRFALRTLSPGAYLVRAHLNGFITSQGKIVDVRPSSRASSSIALRHATTPSPEVPVLAAGFGPSAAGEAPAAPANPPASAPKAIPGATSGATSGNDDHGEIAWRLRHLRRGILQEITEPDALVADESPTPDTTIFGPSSGRFLGSSARLATNFFAGTPFSGQFNLLTTSSFDTPQQLFSGDNFAGSVAYISVGAPAGSRADWAVRGAISQADISSWVVEGVYSTRGPARHHYDIGLSYATERYDGGNPATLRDVTDGSRNAGAIYGFDTFTITPAVAVSFGARYARYDYLDGKSLISPRVQLTLSPGEHFRINTLVSRRAVAPGAEEFLPPGDNGIWLPPQRTFSSLSSGRPLDAEHTTHFEAELERDLGSASAVSVRAFRQHVDDQLVTMFDVEVPGLPPATLGHYFVGNCGAVGARGVSAAFRTHVASRIRGSVEYSLTRAQWNPGGALGYWMLQLPSASPLRSDRIHDLATRVETDLPETSTRIVVLYRVSNAFARRHADDEGLLDSRFDVQVHQSLPFLDFSTAKWEMLLGVRNFFRDAAAGQSVYDELLVVRPPKRIVGGLTMRF